MREGVTLWRMALQRLGSTLCHARYINSKVETPYHDNDLILTPIISPQSGWQ
jgi:hypothetical protein